MKLSEYPTSVTADAVDKSNPACANPAVARCCKAWKKVYLAVMEDEDNHFHAARSAGEAYRVAMPSLTPRENCRDFIARVAQGILIGAIADKNGGKLLYAAQVALAIANSDQKSQNVPAPYANLTDSEAERARKFEDVRSK